MSVIRGRERLRALFANRTSVLAKKVEAIIVEEFYRILSVTPGTRRATQKMPTPRQVLALFALKRANPNGNEGDQGRGCGIRNHGRVSEILHGKINPKTGKKVLVYSRRTGERIA